jgi:hypothetical protein
LLQSADQFQAGAIPNVCKARILMPTEVALADLAVLGAIKERTPCLEFPDALGCFLGV